MKTTPMLFNGEMVRALLDGRKVQTRRIVKPQLPGICSLPATWEDGWTICGHEYHCQYGQPGDLIWVRETFTRTQYGKPVYRADAKDMDGQRWSSISPGDPEREVIWTPSIHMPRWASRLTLKITDIRVERVQDISNEDSLREGIGHLFAYDENNGPPRDGRRRFRDLWEYLNGSDSWDQNPWVWVISFDVINMNIDKVLQ